MTTPDSSTDSPDWLPAVPDIDPSIMGAQQILEWMVTLGRKVDTILTEAGAAHTEIRQEISAEADARRLGDQAAAQVAAAAASAAATALQNLAALSATVAAQGARIDDLKALVDVINADPSA